MQSVRPVSISSISTLRLALSENKYPLPLHQLHQLLSTVAIAPDQWMPHLTFNFHHFSCRTIYESANFELNIIGWRSGQFSSIHDHRGTACCVLVLDGVLTNIDYRLASGTELKETSRVELHAGEILCRNDCEIHCCGNHQSSGADLATLHLYSPPLKPLAERQQNFLG